MNKKKMENEIDCLDQMLSDWKKIEMKVAFEFKTSWKERERDGSNFWFKIMLKVRYL